MFAFFTIGAIVSTAGVTPDIAGIEPTLNVTFSLGHNLISFFK